MPAYYGDFVLPPALADGDDLAAYMGADAPVNADQLLRSATALVLDATNQAYYSVDPATGLATDAQIGAAMNQATCAQAAAWSLLGVDPLVGGVGVPTVVSSTGIDTAREVYADAAAAAQARTDALTKLVPDAERVLRLNNLLIPLVWWYG